MSADFIIRIIGMAAFSILGVYVGNGLSSYNPEQQLFYTITFTLIGALIGLILTPYLTTRPIRALRALLGRLSAETLFAALIGLVGALLVGASGWTLAIAGWALVQLVLPTPAAYTEAARELMQSEALGTGGMLLLVGLSPALCVPGCRVCRRTCGSGLRCRLCDLFGKIFYTLWKTISEIMRRNMICCMCMNPAGWLVQGCGLHNGTGNFRSFAKRPLPLHWA